MLQRATIRKAATLTAVVAAASVVVGISSAESAFASESNFGQQVVACANMMLPYDLGPDGSITMTMPDGTVMHFTTFGAMVTYMQANPMCS